MTVVSQQMDQGKILNIPAVTKAVMMMMTMVTVIHQRSPKKTTMMKKKKLSSFLGLLDLNMKHVTWILEVTLVKFKQIS
jgi:hypothetical protein